MCFGCFFGYPGLNWSEPVTKLFSGIVGNVFVLFFSIWDVIVRGKRWRKISFLTLKFVRSRPSVSFTSIFLLKVWRIWVHKGIEGPPPPSFLNKFGWDLGKCADDFLDTTACGMWKWENASSRHLAALFLKQQSQNGLCGCVVKLCMVKLSVFFCFFSSFNPNPSYSAMSVLTLDLWPNSNFPQGLSNSPETSLWSLSRNSVLDN